jgi:hypothetical protein
LKLKLLIKKALIKFRDNVSIRELRLEGTGARLMIDEDEGIRRGGASGYNTLRLGRSGNSNAVGPAKTDNPRRIRKEWLVTAPFANQSKVKLIEP